MLKVVVSPEHGVLVKDDRGRVVAIMSTEVSRKRARSLAQALVDADKNKAKLDAALETIKATIKTLRRDLADRDVRRLVNEALYPLGGAAR
jgi:glycine cleavage system aminomethyltransferase T